MVATKEPTQKVLKSQASKNIPDYVWDEAKKELKTVKGRFRIYEKGRDGGWEKISFKKYPPEICPKFSKLMRDGEVYEIPLYAARFINGYDSCAKAINGKINSCAVGKHGFKMMGANDLKPSIEAMGPEGVTLAPTEHVKYERRYGFESLEFSGDVA